MKILANYLPQYHVIPENSLWWGEGYTDWVSTKNAKPLFPGHVQPKRPLHNYYYSLDNPEDIRWQARIAREYCLDGFAIYHYWFSSNLRLLTKPAEIILQNKDIDIDYLFLWDNTTWARSWSGFGNDWAPSYEKRAHENGGSGGVLAKLEYGNVEDWNIHFQYLLPFFKDSRYIKIDNRPVLGFMKPLNGYNAIVEMSGYWNELAKEHGFDGLYCMTRDQFKIRHRHDQLSHKFLYANGIPNTPYGWLCEKFKTWRMEKFGSLRLYDYDLMWRSIIRYSKRRDNETFLSALVSFDDSPRRGKRGRIYTGATPAKFEKYLKQLLNISKEQDKELLFVSAWNEWGEGMYLEPDEENGYAWLEALRSAIQSVNG